MAETNGFNGSNKPKLSDSISNSNKWTAFARVSSALNAFTSLVGAGILAWGGLTLIEVQKTSVRTEVQLDDFKNDAERSRGDMKEKIADINARLDRQTNWFTSSINRLTERVDNIRHQ